MKNSARDRETARSNFWSVWTDRYLYEAKNEKCIKGDMRTNRNRNRIRNRLFQQQLRDGASNKPPAVTGSATGDGSIPCRRHELLPGCREIEESMQQGLAARFLQATKSRNTCG